MRLAAARPEGARDIYMNKEFIIQSVRAASQEVFSTMLGMEVEYGPVYEEHESVDTASGVLGLIGIAGPWMGTGSLSCSPEFACKISSLLLMSKFDHIDGDVLDAIAEIVNMIFGNVKTVLEDKVGPLGLSIPTVIYGKNFSTKQASSQIWAGIPLFAGGMRMELTMGLRRNHSRCMPTGLGFDHRSYPLTH